MSLLLERTYPYIIAAAASGIWLHLEWHFPGDREVAILSSSLTFGAIMTGFLTTSQTMITSMSMPLKKQLVSSGYMDELSRYLSEAILLSFLFATVSMIGFFTALKILSTVWCFSGVAAALSFYRITRIMLKILRNAN